MKQIKNIVLAALCYMLAGPVLLFIDFLVLGKGAYQQALPITLLASVFFAYTLAVCTFSDKLRSMAQKTLTAFYLANNVIRLLLTAIILVVYCVATDVNRLPFAVNLFVYYLLTVVWTSYYIIKKENVNQTKLQ